MRSKKIGLRSMLKSTKRTKNLRQDRKRRFEQLEGRNLLAFSSLGVDSQPLEGPLNSPNGGLFTPAQFREGHTDRFLTDSSAGAALDVALNYLRSNAGQLGLTSSSFNSDNFKITNQYRSDTGVTHIYMRQLVNGLEVVGADLNVNVTEGGEIVNVGSTFVNLNTTGAPSPQADLTPLDAYSEFADNYGLTFSVAPTVIDNRGGIDEETVLSTGGVATDEVKAEKVYVPVDGGGVALGWRLNVPLLNHESWLDVTVSAETGETLHVVDWVRHASYRVYAEPNEDPGEGGRSVITNPQDPVASPFGWHDVNGLPGPEFFDTRGNNVDAREDRAGNFLVAGNPLPTTRPNGGPGLNFDAPINTTQEPFTYTNAAVINLFYWTNFNHDVFFRYGFDEIAGNFQSTNYTGQGQDSDPILALSQIGDAGAALNNAFYTVTPDGIQPALVMGTFDLDLSDLLGGNLPTISPRTDSSVDNGIITHEYGHGVSTRLTGGANNVGTLFTIQAASLGEGWSDFFALMFTQRDTDQPTDAYPIAGHINGVNPVTNKGIRRFAYSFDMGINPLTFADFNAGTDPTCLSPTSNCESHNAGEIWASALWDLNWLLVEKYGFASDLIDDVGGNTLTMQLVMDGLKLQPNNPTFLEARDAILQADLIRNNGVNHPEIWEAFARRGMGVNADADIFDTLGSNSIDVAAGFALPNNQGSVSGTVFQDDNGNGVRDGNEKGLAGWEVFIDLDEDGNRDPLEPTFPTAANGNYTIDFLAAGQYTIDVVIQDGHAQTAPSTGSHAVTISGGQSVANVDFGARPGNLQSTGVKFNDLNGNGKRDAGEPGVPNVWIYVDYDNDGRFDLGEPAAVSGADGRYALKLERPGTFFVREVETPGWVQTFPGGTNQGHEVTVVNGSLNVNFDFGNRASRDFGDAPAPYPTTAANNGASHGILSGFFLGASVDGEGDGIPSAAADGDDNNQTANDEDGVNFNTLLFPGANASIDVAVSSGSFSPGRVNAWFDFNGDGDWNDPGEHVVHDRIARTGTHTFPVNVPTSAKPGLTFARFRYGYNRYDLGDAPVGSDLAGEVEDHRIRILADRPDAIDDQFRVDQNSLATNLDVLANDISSRSGPVFISQTTNPNRGGRVTISANGSTLSYTPNTGFSGVETFRYTIQDQAGNSDTATVTVTVVPLTPAIALDDSFDVNAGSSNNVLNVLANDLEGQDPPISLVDVVPSNNANITIDRRGTADPSDDRILYTPNPGFAATDSFSYIIEDAVGAQDTATVTVHVMPGSLNDDIVEYRLVTTDLTGNPISAIGAGQEFLLQVFVQDLRSDDGDGDPVDRRGVAAGYLDLLYDVDLVSVAGSIQFGGNYQNATSGDTQIPGIIDETGAFQTGLNPLGANEVLLLQVPMLANAGGTAEFVGDPADVRSENNPNTPDHDTLTFQPPEAVGLQGMRFTNTSLQVVGVGGVPVAVDNTFSVPAGLGATTLDVLGNDLDNGSPPLRVTSVTPQGTSGGTINITQGGSMVTYTPPAANFTGVDSFRYTMRNAGGLTSSAKVTVQVGNNPKSFNFRLQATSQSGTPISRITAGSTFRLNVLIKDLRSSDGDTDPRDDRGIFAAYTDVLFDSDVVRPLADSNPNNPLGFQATFGPAYMNGRSGDINTPNLINELGAFQTDLTPLGTSEFLLASITMQAVGSGPAMFQIDPADVSPLHDSLFFEPDDQRVPDNVKVFHSIPFTVDGGSPEGELTNPMNRFDVNADGSVTPIDPLGVINYLNAGSQDAEGESGSRLFVDVSGDGEVSPVDALQVINYLNKLTSTAGEGEGEAPLTSLGTLDTSDSAPQIGSVPTLTFAPVSSTTASSDLDLPALIAPRAAVSNNQHTAGHDQAFAAYDARQLDEADGNSDPLLDELAEDVLDGWTK